MLYVRARALECCVCVCTQKQTNNVVDWYHGVVRPILPLVTLKHLLNRVSISSLSGDWVKRLKSYDSVQCIYARTMSLCVLHINECKPYQLTHLYFVCVICPTINSSYRLANITHDVPRATTLEIAARHRMCVCVCVCEHDNIIFFVRLRFVFSCVSMWSRWCVVVLTRISCEHTKHIVSTYCFFVVVVVLINFSENKYEIIFCFHAVCLGLYHLHPCTFISVYAADTVSLIYYSTTTMIILVIDLSTA